MRDGLKVMAVGFGSGFVGAVVAVAVLGAAPKTKGAVRYSDVVAAKEFRLVDGKGGVRGFWGADDENATALLMYDDGKAMATIRVTPGLATTMGVGEGETGAVLGTGGTVAAVTVRNPHGRVTAKAPEKGSPMVLVEGEEGRPIFDTRK